MDPATALGVAAAIVQFVEVGLKTLALCKQIRDSDSDTSLLHAELQQSTKQLETIQSGVTLTSFPRDTSRSIKQCSQECASTAKELQDLLAEIRAIAQKKRFGIARAAFRALKDQKKIEKIQNKLEKCQARFQTVVNVDTREKVLSLLQAQGKMSQTLEDVVYPELKRMHDSTRSQISDGQKSSAAAHETTHKALASLNQTYRASRREVLEVGAQVQGRLDHLQVTHTQRAFLQSLEHPDMFARHRQIHAPASGTFKWIFMEDSSRNGQSPRTMELQGCFSKWLTSAQPVFWINGKAGSGKSSLMSFIESHKRTHDLLKIWAGGRRLHVFSFFFWRAGSKIQKSISGVLQSLLFQLARAKPEIIGGLVSGETSAPHTTWTQARLHRAIEKALSHFIGDRIFVLIDGLDEFEGSHTALTSLVLGLQNGSHSKFCLSSRPEAALTRELGSFPSLRLQDLNYDDIESFVHGQLKSYENVYGDPWQFRQMTRKVSSRAEGIFLWAALVCRSLISGFESKDDADMLRQRLDVMPSGLEALFELMFSNIDREHREYLSKCFFLLKWSRENGSRVVSDVSIPVITTFLSVSPHRSLSDFMQDCRLVEHRVVARAKGLLETYEPSTSMFDTLDIDLQKFGICILSDAVSGEPGYRFVRQESKVTEMFRIACIGWVHRSAYDYVLGDNSEHTQSWRLSFDEKRLLRRLLDAQSWLARCFPGQHMDPFCPPAMRIANVITGRTDEVMLAGFQALDELHDIIEAALHRRRCTGTDGIPVIDVAFSGVFEEAKPLRAFWASLLNEPLSEYVVTRFDKIKSSAHVDILCSGLIKHWFGPMFGTAQTECTVPAITMSLDHLLHQGPLGSAVIVDPQVDSMIPDSKLFRQICISWRGRNRSIERRMVSDVAYALIKTPDFYRPFRATEDTKPNVEFHHPSPSAAERGESLIELSDLWNIYCGRKRNVSSTKPFIPLCLHVPIWIYWWEYRRYADVYRANSSDRVLPAWRFVCFGQERNRVHQRRPSEHVSAVAWFDVTAAKSKRLMDQFGLVRRARINLGGTSREKALCLETILEEVWADADGQFDDGWQQLYMLTCLKRYFGALWRIPKSYGIEHDGDYK